MKEVLTACPVCKSNDVALLRDYHNSNPVFTGLHIAKCKSCNMVYVTPMPDDDILKKYNESYFETAHGGQPASATTIAFFKAIAQLRLGYLIKYMDAHGIKVSSVLEVGPGPGFFAGSWMKLFPNTKYYALESDASCYESLRSLGVTILNDAKPETYSVDLVVMSHVLEHVSDPNIFITDSTKQLRSGGILFIEVPCNDYMHKDFDEPHLLFFDKKPMMQLLSNLSFEKIQLNYYGQEITNLKKKSFFKKVADVLRVKLIGSGIIAPFAGKKPGMENVSDPLERAAVAPFNAHKESEVPAWWLRALSIKK